MKLLILSTKLPYPAKDGGAIATLSLALGLAKCGIEVTMLCINTKKHFFPPAEIPDEIKKVITILTITSDTSLKPFKALSNLLFSREPYIATRYFSIEFSEKLKTLLAANFDVVQLEGPYLAKYIPVIKKYSRAKISFRAHNVEHEIWERRSLNEKRPLVRLYINNLAKRIKKLEYELLHDLDLLIAISDRDQKKLSAIYNDLQCIIIPTGIEISDYTLIEPSEKNGICYIGALDWAPNIEGVLWFIHEVLPLLSGEHLKIHIAGRNAANTFQKKIKHPDIFFHGEVDDAREFISRFDIMIVPLLSGSGMRIKILEGMALGRCIISTSIGAEGIPAEEGKEILIGDDGKTFAQKILKILNNSELKNNISKNARKLIEEKFDNFAFASQLAVHYKNLK